MTYQPINVIIGVIAVCLFKMMTRKGVKSKAFNILSLIFVVGVLVALSAVSLHSNIDNVNKVSFLAVGNMHRKSITEKRDENLPKKKNQPDLSVLSSFDCSRPFPQTLHSYIDNTFKTEFQLSHDDIHQKRPDEESLPVLMDVQTNCTVDSECQTLFEYDKQYGINTTVDNVRKVNDMFLCCPHESASNRCKQAKSIIRKSSVREAKSPVLLETVSKT